MLPLRPTHDGVFIDIVDRDVTKKDLGGGKFLHLLPDDGFSGPHNSMAHKHPGIRPRWARVLGIGPDVYEDEVALGDLVLCDTLKWGRGFTLGRDGLERVQIWRIKVSDIMLVNAGSSGEEFLKHWEDRLSRLKLTIGRL